MKLATKKRFSALIFETPFYIRSLNRDIYLKQQFFTIKNVNVNNHQQRYNSTLTIEKVNSIFSNKIIRNFQRKVTHQRENVKNDCNNYFYCTLRKNRSFKRTEQQREFMEEIFYELKLQNFSEWLQISKETIKKKGGKVLLHFYYSNDLKKLFSNIYPNYPWNFYTKEGKEEEEFQKVIGNFGKLKEKLRGNILLQREVMNRIFFILKLNSIDEWKKIKKKKFIQVAHSLHKKIIINNKITNDNYINNINNNVNKNNVGKYLLEIYSNNFNELLKTIFPDHNWNFDNKNNLNNINNNNNIIENNNNNINKNIIINKLENFEYQQKLIDRFYGKFHLTSLDDWKLISPKFISENGGKKLIKLYEKNIKKMVTSLYPNFPWNFDDHFEKEKLIINKQREKMNFLYKKMKFKSMNDWLEIPRWKLIKFGAGELMEFYSNDFKKLLCTIYPNYQFNFNDWKYESKFYFYYKENQFKFMENLFNSFKFQSFDDWLTLSNKKFKKEEKGKILLKTFYSNNLKKLFLSLYPNYPWKFSLFQFNDRIAYKSIDFIRENILNLIKQYKITREKDWYRLNTRIINRIPVKRLLQNYFSNFKWNTKFFSLKSKKSNQRLLFACLENIFINHFLYENYYHPYMISDERVLEFDVYIPAFNLAFEYQGEHHYSDMPNFGHLESFYHRDLLKRNLSTQLEIKLISVPYWWDFSNSSLLSSVFAKLFF